jgi:hypothetical protein
MLNLLRESHASGISGSGSALNSCFLLLACGLEIPLLGISEWVVYVPVVIIWALYLVVPLIYPRPAKPHGLLRAYAVNGWVFVGAVVGWAVCYLVFSHLFGTPISDQMLQQYRH